MANILLVSDEVGQGSLAALLRRAGYIPIETSDSGEALQETLDRTPQLIIMAKETPPVEGVDLLPLLRRVTQAPILVIGPDAENDLVQALLHGADSYIKQPVDPDELLARIRNILRRQCGPRTPDTNLRCQSGLRTPDTNQSLLQFTDFSSLACRMTDLTPVEAKLLNCLIARKGGVAPPKELMLGVWGEGDKSPSLRFYIKRLRQKLSAVAPVAILNVKGRGYRLVKGLGAAGTAGAQP